jgi:energy-coupling factor transport system ATP-binding protein
MKPEIIIFDESTAMLDPLGRREVVSIMERLNREDGITVLNITHYMEEAARADRVIVINDGKLALDGTPRQIFSNVKKLREMGLDAPQGNELILELKNAGLKIDGSALTEDECIETLYNYLSANKGN